MKRNGLILLLAVFAPLIGSCVSNYIVTCTEDSYCGTKNPGICVFAEGLPGACGVPDRTCASGYRYYKDSPAGLSNQCAVLPTFAVKPQLTETEEHKVFSVHVEVTDGNGKKFISYKGDPVVSSDWGDARVFSFSGFSNGEADYTLWLNRETNITDGDAHISLKGTGGVSGRSMGVKVTAPAWMPTEYETDPTKGTGSMDSLILTDNTYRLWFAGEKDIYHSTLQRSDFPVVWPKIGDPVLTIKQTPFYEKKPENYQEDYISEPIVASSGVDYRMIYTVIDPNSVIGFHFFGIAESTDGIQWISKRQTALAVPPSSQGDECGSTISQIWGLTYEGEKKYRMFYKASADCTTESLDGGLTWQPGTKCVWAEGNRPIGDVQKDGSIYRLFGHSIATSGDGIHWRNSAVEPISSLRAVVWNENKKIFIGFSNTSVTGGHDYKILTRP